MPLRASAIRFPVIVGLVAACLMSAGVAQAQFPGWGAPEESVGVRFWYDFGWFTTDDAAKGASNEVKGYTDIVPRHVYGGGPAIGLRLKNWSINLGHSEFDADLKDRKADVNQTPGNTADDVTVRSLRVDVTSVAVLYQLARWLSLGYGKDQGALEFRQVSAAGSSATRRIAIDNPFYALGAVLAFEPIKKGPHPIVTVFAKIPAERKPFSGSTQTTGIGLYFAF